MRVAGRLPDLARQFLQVLAVKISSWRRRFAAIEKQLIGFEHKSNPDVPSTGEVSGHRLRVMATRNAATVSY